MSTVEIDNETLKLINIYCTLNDIKIKDFMHDLVNEKLSSFKEKLDNMKRLEI